MGPYASTLLTKTWQPATLASSHSYNDDGIDLFREMAMTDPLPLLPNSSLASVKKSSTPNQWYHTKLKYSDHPPSPDQPNDSPPIPPNNQPNDRSSFRWPATMLKQRIAPSVSSISPWFSTVQSPAVQWRKSRNRFRPSTKEDKKTQKSVNLKPKRKAVIRRRGVERAEKYAAGRLKMEKEREERKQRKEQQPQPQQPQQQPQTTTNKSDDKE